MSSNKKSLFQYAILHHNKTATKEGEYDYETTIIVEPTTVLSKSSDQVGIIAARGIPEKYLEDLENVDIVVKPF